MATLRYLHAFAITGCSEPLPEGMAGWLCNASSCPPAGLCVVQGDCQEPAGGHAERGHPALPRLCLAAAAPAQPVSRCGGAASRGRQGRNSMQGEGCSHVGAGDTHMCRGCSGRGSRGTQRQRRPSLQHKPTHPRPLTLAPMPRRAAPCRRDCAGAAGEERGGEVQDDVRVHRGAPGRAHRLHQPRGAPGGAGGPPRLLRGTMVALRQPVSFCPGSRRAALDAAHPERSLSLLGAFCGLAAYASLPCVPARSNCAQLGCLGAWAWQWKSSSEECVRHLTRFPSPQACHPVLKESKELQLFLEASETEFAIEVSRTQVGSRWHCLGPSKAGWQGLGAGLGSRQLCRRPALRCRFPTSKPASPAPHPARACAAGGVGRSERQRRRRRRKEGDDRGDAVHQGAGPLGLQYGAPALRR